MLLRRTCLIIAFFAIGSAIHVAAGNAVAAIVVPMPVEMLADHAGAVVVGSISEISSYRAEGPAGILSRVVLIDVQFLKGGPAAAAPSTLEFTVPGGTVEQLSLHVCGAPDFAVGQQWVLFLLPRFRTHPVVGVSQGAFQVRADEAGIERMYTAAGRKLISLPPTGFVQSADDDSSSVRVAGSTAGVSRLIGANGVRVPSMRQTDAHAEAMTLSEFRDALRPVLVGSRPYGPDTPVAQYEPIPYTPVALQAAPHAHRPLSAGSRATRPPSRAPQLINIPRPKAVHESSDHSP